MFSLIVPTYNEAKNIESLLQKVSEVLKNVDYEVLVVDDNSLDGTGEFVRRFSSCNRRVNLITRQFERGLSSAVLEGFLHSKGEILGVMDADHSHDPRLLPEMVKLIEQGKADCVVGSRRIAGGGADKWPWYRKWFSNIATYLAYVFAGVKIADPMSGFFCISRDFYEKVVKELKPKGYKILLEILGKAKSLKIVERPYIFIDRKQGYSKLSVRVITSYLLQLIDLFFYRIKSKSNAR